jgi:ADP-ribose pyrophosphatase
MRGMKPQSQTVHFTGRVIRVTTDEVILPNGHRARLEVVHHPGGAAAVAVDATRRVCLLRQYRYVADGWLWELPAGKLEPAEPPLATAQRELREECGLTGGSWTRLGGFWTTPGFSREYMHVFLAEGAVRGEAAPDADEELELVRRPATGVESLIPEIEDAKTLASLLLYLTGRATTRER